MDQNLGIYCYPSKSAIWYIPLYHRCKEVAATNAYVVYKSMCQGEGKEAMTFVKESLKDSSLNMHDQLFALAGQPPCQGG